MRKALIVFSRVPVPGATKTRLQKNFTGEECAELHRAILMDLKPLTDGEDWDSFVYYTPAGGEAVMRKLLPGAAGYEPQPEKEFGARVSGCIGQILEKGYDACVLVGTDIPALDTKIIGQAFAVMEEKDMVIGATEDAGYYLIGMKKLRDEVFRDQAYGTGSVFADTLEKIKGCGCTYGVLPVLRDIDEPEDVSAYLEMYEAGRLDKKMHTWECILRLNEKYQLHND